MSRPTTLHSQHPVIPSSSTKAKVQPASAELIGLLLGFIAIAAFSVTLPATRLALSHLSPYMVGLGRALLAAIPALIILLIFKLPRPSMSQWRGLVLVMLTIIIGFPLLTSIAMQRVSGAEGGIVVSVLPLFTAIAGARLMRQRPSYGFWLMAFVGSALILLYFSLSRKTLFQPDELLLLFASAVCALGYAVGARLAQVMGGLAVMSWSLLLSVPVSLVGLLISFSQQETHAITVLMHTPLPAWMGFVYISLVSQFLAFVLWYKALALGGVIRVSQIQLVQPFLTLLVAAVLLGESISGLMLVFASAVMACVFIGRRMPIYTGD